MKEAISRRTMIKIGLTAGALAQAQRAASAVKDSNPVPAPEQSERHGQGPAGDGDSVVNRAIDHRYACHWQRFTLSMPEGASKILLDLWEPGLALRWSEDSLTSGGDAFNWPTFVKPTRDLLVVPNLPPGWTRTFDRLDGFPVAIVEYEGPQGSFRIQATDGSEATIVRLGLKSTGKNGLSVNCDVVTSAKTRYRDLALFADEKIFCFPGSEDKTRSRPLKWPFGIPVRGSADGFQVQLHSRGGEDESWLVIPHKGVARDLTDWRKLDLSAQWDGTLEAWRQVMTRAAQFVVPDRRVHEAYQACLADQFVLREPIKTGMGFICGTDIYRISNVFEIRTHVQTMLRAGFAEEAWQVMEPLLLRQEESGRWEPADGWVGTFWHHTFDYAAMFAEYYRFTEDKKRMSAVYPRLVRLARWAEGERSKSKSFRSEDPRYGLMPPGDGDSGLQRDFIYAGRGENHVFFSHNMGNVGMLRIVAELAREFGDQRELSETQAAYKDARDCLLAALERCAVPNAAGRWFPASPEPDCGGSLWGSLILAYPAQLVPYDHPLVSGTIRKWEDSMGPTGIPLNIGWLPYGIWPGGAIEGLAPVYLRRGEVDKLTDLVYAALNHASPVWTWPEERQPGAGTPLTSGDLQEAWFPVNFCQLFRDLFLYEEEGELHLGAGLPRAWIASGKPAGTKNASSHFGRVSFEMQLLSEPREFVIKGSVERPSMPRNVIAHVNLPTGRKLTQISHASGVVASLEGDRIRSTLNSAEFELRVRYG